MVVHKAAIVTVLIEECFGQYLTRCLLTRLTAKGAAPALQAAIALNDGEAS